MNLFNRNKLRLNYFNRLVLTINVVVLLVAYTIYLNKIFTPKEFPYFNFISIGFPIIFVIVLGFLFYWMLVSWRYFLIVLLLSAPTFYPIYLSYPIINLHKKSEEKPNLSVMTFNTHGFKDDGTKELIEANLTDIMLFQEAREYSQKIWRDKKLKNYYKEHYDLLTIYSKYPIIQTNVIKSTDDSSIGLAAYADIDLGFDTIRVINMYMEPMQIKKEQVKDVINSDTREEIELSSKVIRNKLIQGMKLHEKQLETLIPRILSSPYPVILGTDLNSTPNSYEYEHLKKYLEDSYIKAGKGNSTTFHGFKFPIRIDYLFNSRGIKVVNAKVIRKKFSDHYPVIVDYYIPN